jgi:hypothetical protein
VKQWARPSDRLSERQLWRPVAYMSGYDRSCTLSRERFKRIAVPSYQIFTVVDKEGR